MADFSLVCPFLSDDPAYAHGVEFGMLFERMKRTRRVRDYFLVDNEEQVTLLANRLGWTVSRGKEADGWVFLTLRKAG